MVPGKVVGNHGYISRNPVTMFSDIIWRMLSCNFVLLFYFALTISSCRSVQFVNKNYFEIPKTVELKYQSHEEIIPFAEFFQIAMSRMYLNADDIHTKFFLM